MPHQSHNNQTKKGNDNLNTFSRDNRIVYSFLKNKKLKNKKKTDQIIESPPKIDFFHSKILYEFL